MVEAGGALAHVRNRPPLGPYRRPIPIQGSGLGMKLEFDSIFAGNRSFRVDVKSEINWVSLKTPNSILIAQAESVLGGRCVKFKVRTRSNRGIGVIKWGSRANLWNNCKPE